MGANRTARTAWDISFVPLYDVAARPYNTGSSSRLFRCGVNEEGCYLEKKSPTAAATSPGAFLSVPKWSSVGNFVVSECGRVAARCSMAVSTHVLWVFP